MPARRASHSRRETHRWSVLPPPPVRVAEVTRQTGREIALLWDKTAKQNLVSIGVKHKVSVPEKLALQRYRLIWHTHPVPPVGSTSALPSVNDGKIIVTLGQQSSFIIPAETDDFIVKFWGEAL